MGQKPLKTLAIRQATQPRRDCARDPWSRSHFGSEQAKSAPSPACGGGIGRGEFLARHPGKGYMRNMRDLFEDLFRREPIDPVEAARRAVRPQLPRRFYRSAGVGEWKGEFRLLLDGRPARTPARHPLAVPTRALAQALADEWEAQREHIDPAKMPLTRLVNSILDGVKTAA